MTAPLHFDEARAAAIDLAPTFIGGAVGRAIVVIDLFGRVHMLLEVIGDPTGPALEQGASHALAAACSQYFAGVTIIGPASEDRLLWEAAWKDGVPIGDDDRLRVSDRHRSRSGWFLPTRTPSRREGAPPVVVFHSFKGGVGRTTALAAYAVHRARAGDHVAVIDVDLDAPGIGRLLDADGAGATARWGVVDYLLEANDELPLGDYHHRCAREGLTGTGSIEVFPSGPLERDYLEKLARVDLEVGRDVDQHPVLRLVRRIRDELRPSVILLDGRAGLSPAAGLLLSGFADMHVLFATINPQSLAGLARIVRHMGHTQAQKGQLQAECIVVQAMIPEGGETERAAKETFAGQVETIFEANYYAQKEDPDDALWSLADLDSSVAPHRPVPITYRQKYAFLATLDEVADDLLGHHRDLAARLDERLEKL